MKLTFISNYINHHQIPFSDACFGQLGGDYAFIQTSPMEEERIAMGWNADAAKLPYVHCLYEEEGVCRQLIMESDVLLAGWTEREDLIGERLQAGLPTVRISERLYREGQWKAISPRGLLRKYKEHTQYRNKPVYLLCAGAYVPSDFHIIRAYPDKMFRWGYFPETRHYGEELWTEKKAEKGPVQLVWAGRFIPLKHPEYVIKLAKELKEAGYQFHIHMVGSGDMDQELREMSKISGADKYITFHGFCAPEQVREVMEECHIHLFTSNHLEGWGAVVNEAMNSGCAVVASEQAGGVPYLIDHGVNGLIYRDGSYRDMVKAVKYLMDHSEEREKMGRAAYTTITALWNAETAAMELIRFLRKIKEGDIIPARTGPVSIAPVIPPGRNYHNLKIWREKESGKK